MAKWRKEFNPDEVVKRLEEAKSGSTPGNVSFTGFEVSEQLLILGGMIEIAPEIPDLERRKIVNAAAFEAGAKGQITANSFLHSCQGHEAEYFRKPVTDFRLLTGISIASDIQLRPIRMGTLTITFNPRARVAEKNRAKLHQEVKFSLGYDLPTRYMNASVAVKARSPHEAAQRALDGIDLVRATWNLWLNRSKSWRISTGRPSPVNEILLFPFHSVHAKNGRLATESWWYDPSYSGPGELFTNKAKIAKLIEFSSKVRACIRRSAYSDDLTSALVRYVRALDSADLHDAFLRLWGVLEFLTDSTFESYKVTVRRAAFIFSNRNYTIQALTNLMNHRNRFVHAGTDADEIEPLLYLLKRYVEQLLIFHIGNSFKFESRTAAANFMDLPASRAQIDRRITILRNARKFIVTP
jgi:hypothetical protein